MNNTIDRFFGVDTHLIIKSRNLLSCMTLWLGLFKSALINACGLHSIACAYCSKAKHTSGTVLVHSHGVKDDTQMSLGYSYSIICMQQYLCCAESYLYTILLYTDDMVK